MIGIDTNILVRYLTNDDEQQSLIVSKLFRHYAGTESSIYINNIVICEVIWVLETAYNYPKQQIVHAIKLILQTPEFVFDNHAIIVKALYQYEQSIGVDFSDILISSTNTTNGCSETYSFDKKAVKLGLFKEPTNNQIET